MPNHSSFYQRWINNHRREEQSTSQEAAASSPPPQPATTSMFSGPSPWLMDAEQIRAAAEWYQQSGQVPAGTVVARDDIEALERQVITAQAPTPSYPQGVDVSPAVIRAYDALSHASQLRVAAMSQHNRDMWILAQGHRERGRDAVADTLERIAFDAHAAGSQQRTERPSRSVRDAAFGMAYGGAHSHSLPRQSYPFEEASVGPVPRRRNDNEQTQTFSGNVAHLENNEMTTVAQVFGQRASYATIEQHPLIVGSNLCGVEIELENLRIERPRFNYWTAKGDGSLRNNGMEFVFTSPWGGVDLYNAAIEIDSFLFDNNPEDTWRCSTHVHVDVRNMTVPQLKRMFLAYLVYERVLFKCSGWHRYKNNFCLALGFAQEMLATLSNNWNKDDTEFLNNITGAWDKYSAMNLLPMTSFGSVEFRISEAKWRKGKLIRLANRFLSLKEVAMSFDGTDDEFLNHLMNTPIQKVIRKGLPRQMPDMQQDIEYGLKIANDVLYMSKLRRKTVRSFVPDLTDGSRIMQDCSIFDNGWRHCISHLQRRYETSLEFPRRCPTDINFNWLYELRSMMRDAGATFEAVWFMPERNRNQYQRLFSDFCEQRDAEMPQEPRVPRSRRGRDEVVPSFEEQNDTDEDYSDDEDF